jgi:hypothetical protein
MPDAGHPAPHKALRRRLIEVLEENQEMRAREIRRLEEELSRPPHLRPQNPN